MRKMFSETKLLLGRIVGTRPSAVANIKGNEEYKDIFGMAEFYDYDEDTVVVVVLHNLQNTDKNFFGFHIHEGGKCDGDFSSAGGHFGGDVHPRHKGDMPVLLSSGGDAFAVFLTDRFTVNEILGKAVIVHMDADDFNSQPAGNSGKRIACGIVEKVN